MTTLKRILVPVDFSECSRLALRRADELAKALDAKLDVLNVWQVPEFAPPEALVAVTPQGQTLGQLAQQNAEKSLHAMGTHGRTGLSHLLLGSVAQKVVRRASRPVMTVRETPAAASG
jgi:nucleotide-binding universal stress UspA family protein